MFPRTLLAEKSDQGGAVLEQHHEGRRILAVAHGAKKVGIAHLALEAAQGDPPCAAVEHRRHSQHDIVDHRVLDGCRSHDMGDAFIEGETRADSRVPEERRRNSRNRSRGRIPAGARDRDASWRGAARKGAGARFPYRRPNVCLRSAWPSCRSGSRRRTSSTQPEDFRQSRRKLPFGTKRLAVLRNHGRCEGHRKPVYWLRRPIVIRELLQRKVTAQRPVLVQTTIELR